jgi:prepilin-type N-terminal cleavage/methylation domain-containing protein
MINVTLHGVCCYPQLGGKAKQGFSLLELLAVMAIMAMVVAVSTPAVNALKGTGDFDQAAYQVASALEQARAYALANNTYVYMGLTERDGADPQTSGQGRLVLMLMASKDGTRGYDLNSPSPLSSSALVLLSKPVVLQNLHLAASKELSKTGALQERPELEAGSQDLALVDSATPIASALGSTSYTFSKVIQFDPQGVARVHTASNDGDEVPLWIEIALQEAKGNTVPSNAQEGAIQVAGVSGAVRVYRP